MPNCYVFAGAASQESYCGKCSDQIVRKIEQELVNPTIELREDIIEAERTRVKEKVAAAAKEMMEDAE